MKKPWHEDWTPDPHADGPGCVTVLAPHEPLTDGMMFSDYFGHIRARKQLAAAAPPMARLLELLEWSGPNSEDGPTCARCKASRFYDGGAGEHRSDCSWLATMRLAGVRS
jgi:hypothetical protein